MNTAARIPQSQKKRAAENLISSSIILIAAAVLLFPYAVYVRNMLADGFLDDTFTAYKLFLAHPADYAKDVFSYDRSEFLWGSFLNYGTLWIHEFTGAPLESMARLYLFWMFLALPLIFVFYVRKYLPPLQLPFVFFAASLSQWDAWNLALFGPYTWLNIPYAAAVAEPLVYLGLLSALKRKFLSYVFLAAAALFHPSYSLYGIGAVFFYLIIERRPLRARDALGMTAVLAAACFPLIRQTFSGAAMSSGDFMTNAAAVYHAAPWLYHRWIIFILILTGFCLVIFTAKTERRELGFSYEHLLSACVLTAIVFGALHVLGSIWHIPSMLSPLGLRAVSIFVCAAFPVFCTFLARSFTHSGGTVRYMGAFTYLTLLYAAHFGLDVIGAALLCASFFWMEKTDAVKRTRAAAVLWVLIILWSAVWLASSFPWFQDYIHKLPFTQHVSSHHPVFYAASRVKAWEKMLILSGAGVAALSGALPEKFKKRAAVFSVVFLILLSFYPLFKRTFFFSAKYGSQEKNDLYDAQIWARENTAGDALFIAGLPPAWRNYSGRPAVLAAYHRMFYTIDPKAHELDARISRFYEGIKVKYGSPLTHRWELYKLLRAEDFKELARLTEADYLVEQQELPLPVLYKNSTYKIYDLRENGIPGRENAESM